MRRFTLGLSGVFVVLVVQQASAVVGIGFADSDGLLDAQSTISGPGQSATFSINLSITGGETVGGITILPKADKPNVVHMSARSILSATLTDPTADVLASPTLNPQALVDVGVTTPSVNVGVSQSQAVMQLTVTVEAGTPLNAYPIVLSLGKARWATIGANSVSANADTTAAIYTIYPPCTTPPAVVSAASRKTHGAAGDFDLPLPTAGPVAVECRQNGPSLIVVNYDKFIAGPVLVAASGATAGAPILAGNQLAVPLSSVADGACVSVTITGVACAGNPLQAAPSHTIKVRSLWGDVSGSGNVDAADIGMVKLQSLKPLTPANFRMDVSVSGGIDAADIGMVKLRSLKVTPDACSY